MADTPAGAVTVRRAEPGDAAAVARIQVRGWHEAYTGRMPQEILDRLDEVRATESWGRTLRGESRHPAEVYLAERDGTAVGMAAAGPCRDADRDPAARELYAIYVLAAHYGSGAGQALLDAAVGDAPASLWVLEDNPRARAFYARNRLTPDGIAKDDTRWGAPIREVRLTRP